jgi:hypothetical protein
VSAFFSAVDTVSSGFSELIATSEAPGGHDLRKDRLIRLQFEVAVRAPATAIKGDDDGTVRE